MARTLVTIAGDELLVERLGDEPVRARRVHVHGPSALTAEGLVTRARIDVDGEPLNTSSELPTGAA
jgi:hypothetical protein